MRNSVTEETLFGMIENHNSLQWNCLLNSIKKRNKRRNEPFVFASQLTKNFEYSILEYMHIQSKQYL